jgi:hypothetical protein
MITVFYVLPCPKAHVDGWRPLGSTSMQQRWAKGSGSFARRGDVAQPYRDLPSAMAMAPATNLGAATPVQLIGGPPPPPAAPASSFRDGKPPSLAETPDTEMRKVTNDAAERGQSAFRDFPTSSRVSRAAGISLHPPAF